MDRDNVFAIPESIPKQTHNVQKTMKKLQRNELWKVCVQARKEAGLTQQQLADRMQIHRQQVTQAERPHRSESVQIQLRILRHFGYVAHQWFTILDPDEADEEELHQLMVAADHALGLHTVMVIAE